MPKEAYKFDESQKLKHESRIINVEKSTLNSLVFACTGRAGPLATKVITRLAAKNKGSESYADATSYNRTKISFALLRSSVLCLRGCRATGGQQAIVESSISAIVHDGGLTIPRVLPMKPYNFRRSIKLLIHCPNL